MSVLQVIEPELSPATAILPSGRRYKPVAFPATLCDLIDQQHEIENRRSRPLNSARQEADRRSDCREEDKQQAGCDSECRDPGKDHSCCAWAAEPGPHNSSR
jgi:hypothetical protein